MSSAELVYYKFNFSVGFSKFLLSFIDKARIVFYIDNF